VRRQLVARVARACGTGTGIGALLPQQRDLANQSVDLFLLPVDRQVQLVQQVFGEARLDLEFGQPALGVLQGVHVAIGQEAEAWVGQNAGMDPTIRPLGLAEMPLVIEMAAREGWNPGLHDAACFHAADPGGFLIAEHRGEALGCISAVSYPGRFGFIGLYIVAPAWRGQGVGIRLWRAGMARLAGRTVGLDGVPAQQDNYRRSGFALAWNNARFGGVARGGGRSPQIVALAAVDDALLRADDRRVFPAPRDAFLRAWTGMRDATGLAWLDGGRLAGWGLIRRCRDGHKIAPLVADDPQVAHALFAALCAAVPAGDAVYLDVPLPNAEAVALAEAEGMRCVFETARMYAGATPPCELRRVYGLTSFELG